ncbi:MAG TPA: TolC family protein, partial [Candidatus Kapabacteria bacterium]|nr:TolC family protein [Candidatus Kapabacteria bacterium]
MNIMRLFSILLCCILCCSFSIQAQNVLSLQQAVELALKHNYDILLAKNQSDIQSIENSWANAGAYPTVNAGLTTNYSQFSINQELSNGQTITGSGVTQQNTQAFVTLSWRVFDGMRMFATKSRLEEVQKSGELQLKQQVMQTMYDVCMAY